MDGFFENLKGYDHEITQKFSMALQSQEEGISTTIVRGISIHLNENLINRVIKILIGVKWGKEDRTKSITTKINFFLPKEKLLKRKME